jgi:hypothetical protein
MTWRPAGFSLRNASLSRSDNIAPDFASLKGVYFFQEHVLAEEGGRDDEKAL